MARLAGVPLWLADLYAATGTTDGCDGLKGRLRLRGTGGLEVGALAYSLQEEEFCFRYSAWIEM